MTEPLILIVLGFFILISILDIIFKKVPSILMTGMLFVVIALNPQNIFFGILAYVFAILLRDLDVNRGIADFKATVIIGFMCFTFQSFAFFMLILALLQFQYTMWFKIKKPNVKEFPLLPVYLVTYFLLVIGGLL